MLELRCPDCYSEHIVKNGHIHNGKQNNLCRECGRNFVANPEWREITSTIISQIDRALNERMPLRGICRVFQVSLTWLMDHLVKLFAKQPDHLNAWIPELKQAPPELVIVCEADELWSFVGNKKNQQWIWLVMEKDSRQIVAFHVGKRTSEDAIELWKKIPDVYTECGRFYTDYCKSYEAAIPTEQHRAYGKDAGFTNHIERLNLTLRTKCSRLVRKNICFSKKLENHIGAIKYFICNYNLEKVAFDD